MRFWCQLGSILAPKTYQNRVLETVWRRLGGVLRRLGASWGHLGGVLGRLGCVLARLGRVLGCSMRLQNGSEAKIGEMEAAYCGIRGSAPVPGPPAIQISEHSFGFFFRSFYEDFSNGIL